MATVISTGPHHLGAFLLLEHRPHPPPVHLDPVLRHQQARQRVHMRARVQPAEFAQEGVEGVGHPGPRPAQSSNP